MKKIGMLTIGEAPRVDILTDIEPIFGSNISILQRGAMNGLSEKAIIDIAPNECDEVLVSTLVDGTPVIMAENKVEKLLQNCIYDLENEGTDAILLLCTADFQGALKANIPMIYPNRVLRGLVAALCDKITIIVPDVQQVEDTKFQWNKLGIRVNTLVLSPYDYTLEKLNSVADEAKNADCEYILLDCMGYSKDMKNKIEDISGKVCLLPRTILAAVVKSIIE